MKIQTNALLDQAVNDYLRWMIKMNYSASTWNLYARVLPRFQQYICQQAMAWDQVFTHDSLLAFGRDCRLVQYQPPVRGLARFLFKQQRITQSPDLRVEIDLPDIYHQFLEYYQKTRQVCYRQVMNTRRILVLFSDWSNRRDIPLEKLRIEHLDAFQAEISNRYEPMTRTRHRSVLRGFSRWLYQRKIIDRDLAPLLVGPPQYARAVPPRFLRPDELAALFALQPQTDWQNRTWAMLHLACFTGMRPKEISLVSLDDINFSRQEIILPQRKSGNPITLPLATATVKAIADYIIKTRPKTRWRQLFIQLHAPYNPIASLQVSQSINCWMRTAGVQGSAYQLRHTYAQNLLESGASIFTIRDMLGHDTIQTTKRYIQIHTRMMREVLFHETI